MRFCIIVLGTLLGLATPILSMPNTLGYDTSSIFSRNLGIEKRTVRLPYFRGSASSTAHRRHRRGDFGLEERAELEEALELVLRSYGLDGRGPY